MRRGRLLGVAMVLMLGAGLLMSMHSAYAATEGGGWIGTAAVSGSSGNGRDSSICQSGSTTTINGREIYYNDMYREDCTGVSWIFYDAVKESSGDVRFSPVNSIQHGSGSGTIPQACSAHIDPTGKKRSGFWHYGINGMGGRNSYSYLGIDGMTYNHYVPTGEWGHWSTALKGGRSWYFEVAHAGGAVYNSITDSSGSAIYRSNSTFGAVTSSYGQLIQDYQHAYYYYNISETTKREYESAGYFGIAGPEGAIKQLVSEGKIPSSIPNGTYAFCYWDGMADPGYLAKSNVSAGDNTWATTDMTTAPTGTADVSRAVQVGQQIIITFSHDIYSTQEAKEVSWKLSRDFSAANGDYTIDAADRVPAYSGKVDMTNTEGQYYVPVKPYTYGSDSYFLREQYRVTFNTPGTYTFCEMVDLDKMTTITKVCAKITVNQPDEPVTLTGCNLWVGETHYTQSTNMEGWTEVKSKIINHTLTERDATATYADWQDEITYAKPTDDVTWMHCYYPGVQKAASTIATYDFNGSGHGAHSGHNSTANADYVYSNRIFGLWQNLFKVDSTASAGVTTTGLNRTRATIDGIAYSPFEGALDNNRAGARLRFTTQFAEWLLSRNYSYGDYTVRQVGNDYKVYLKNDVGKTWVETMTSGEPIYVKITHDYSHSWTHTDSCGEDCTYTHTVHHSNVYAPHSRIQATTSDDAKLEVPYNYINTTHFSLSVGDSDPVYAGETLKVTDAYVKVSPKRNDLTRDTYATQVDQAEVRLISYVSTSGTGSEQITGTKMSDLCGFLPYKLQMCVTNNTAGSASKELILNKNVNLKDGTDDHVFNGTKFEGITYNVFDASAGDYYCMVMAVYPATSAADNNLDPKGDDKWYISAPQCRVIAKRPSFTVYGGDLYSNGGIKTSVSTKQNVYKVDNYTYGGAYGSYDPRIHNQSNFGATIFGSWVEHGVVANGYVTLLASGAGVGYADGRAGMGSYEGGSVSFCKNRTMLSFANYNSVVINGLCPNANTVGKAGVQSNTRDRESLATYWIADVEQISAKIGGNVRLNYEAYRDKFEKASSATGKDIYYMYAGNDAVTIDASDIPLNTTYVVRTNGKVTINGDIRYSNEKMNAAGVVPKVIIYAGDVEINCKVSQLDAIVIAKGVVNTCGEYNNNNNLDMEERSNQLVVRGMIIANQLKLTRTYGTAAGALMKASATTPAAENAGSSITPAEAINYDTSAIVWGRYMAGAAESDTLTETYRQELAPRY